MERAFRYRLSGMLLISALVAYALYVGGICAFVGLACALLFAVYIALECGLMKLIESIGRLIRRLIKGKSS